MAVLSAPVRGLEPAYPRLELNGSSAPGTRSPAAPCMDASSASAAERECSSQREDSSRGRRPTPPPCIEADFVSRGGGPVSRSAATGLVSAAAERGFEPLHLERTADRVDAFAHGRHSPASARTLIVQRHAAMAAVTPRAFSAMAATSTLDRGMSSNDPVWWLNARRMSAGARPGTAPSGCARPARPPRADQSRRSSHPRPRRGGRGR